MRKTLIAALFLAWAMPVWAITYPTCPNGAATSCTLTVAVTSAITPILAKLSARQYLLLCNNGYDNATPPVISQTPVWCALGSNNNPVASGGSINTFVIQPGGCYEPPQIVKPQNAFTVPSGDISCIAPNGTAYVTVEQE